jgi:hypothetical protein
LKTTSPEHSARAPKLLPRKMRPSSSASIACIASPAWSGFNRFYQHSRRKTLIAGKTFRAGKKTRHKAGIFSPIIKLSDLKT